MCVCVPTLTNGHKLWAVIKRMRLKLLIGENGFIHMAGLSFKEKMRSLVIQHSRVTQSSGSENILHVQLGRVLEDPGHRDYLSQVVWEHFGFFLKDVAVEREIWGIPAQSAAP